MTATPTQRLGDLLLGGDGALEEFVRSRRKTGVVWRRIAWDLHDLHDFEVTHESLRQWYPDSPTEAAS